RHRRGVSYQHRQLTLDQRRLWSARRWRSAGTASGQLAERARGRNVRSPPPSLDLRRGCFRASDRLDDVAQLDGPFRSRCYTTAVPAMLTATTCTSVSGVTGSCGLRYQPRSWLNTPNTTT